MFFKKYTSIIKAISSYFIIVLLCITHIYAKEQTTQEDIIKQKQINTHNHKDTFLSNILLQDTQSILDSSLPLPYYLQYEQTHYFLQRQQNQQDSRFDAAMQAIKPTTATYDYSQLKDHDITEKEQDIALKIHELEKEAYMLRSQLILLEQKKKNWLINAKRSGYYVGIGAVLGFRYNAQALGIDINSVGAGAILKLGYLRYFYNNLGLKAELFEIYGNAYHDKKNMLYNYYGMRFSLVYDIPMLFANHYFGFFAGFGAGSYMFAKQIQSGQTHTFSAQTHSICLNLHIGASWSYTKHQRLEIERIFMVPIATLSGNMTNTYEPSYIVSYSWVF